MSEWQTSVLLPRRVTDRRSAPAAALARDNPTVVFFITSLGVDGASTQVTELAARLPHLGWKVSGVVSLVKPAAHVHELESCGVPVLSLDAEPGRMQPKVLLRAVRTLQHLRPDIVVPFLFHASVLGSVAAKLAGVPRIVCSVRSEQLGSQRRETWFRLAGALRHATVINSHRAARLLVSRRLISAANSHIVPNGIDAEDWVCPTPPRAREDLGIAEDVFVWLAVGRLTAAKDYPTLLRAFAAFRERNVRLLIAGDGHLEVPLRELAARLRLDERVTFLGLRRDIGDLIRSCNAFVSSSAWEGMPNAIMEAMAGGRAVVATDVGGVSELVHPPTTGFLVTPGRPRDLADAMARVMDASSADVERLGRQGRRVILEKFGWDRVVGEWDRVLRSVLGAQHFDAPGDPERPSAYGLSGPGV